MLSCSHALLFSCPNANAVYHKGIKHIAAYCCVQISREKKTEKILITSCQLCWAWYLEDHPLDAAWQIRQLLLAYNQNVIESKRATSIMLSCSHALLHSCPNANAVYHKCIKHTAAYKSAGKRRQKRFSSQVVSSVELDIWKIILLMQHDK